MDKLTRDAPHLFGSGREPQRAATPAPVVKARPGDVTAAKPSLPMRPVIHSHGREVTLVPIGDLARAIGRSVSHVRALESQGVLPPALRRRRVQGHPGWRLYDQEFVEAVAALSVEERIRSRRAVMDMTAFSQRVWDVHRSLQQSATADGATTRQRV